VDVPDPHKHRDSFEVLHQRQREVKASGIVLHLVKADAVCRGCQVPVRVNGFGEWIDRESHGRWCHAPGFGKARVPHRPDPWTPERLAAADHRLRNRLAREAGQRPPSDDTWALVVELFAAHRAVHPH
jgi:hypothetical protein